MSDPVKPPPAEPPPQAEPPPPAEPQPPAGWPPEAAPPPAEPPPETEPQGELPPLDLSSPGAGGTAKGKEVPLHSGEWANVVKPFSLFVLSLIASVIVIPFVFFLLPYPRGTYMTQALDWAKTVLAPVIGFGGAVVGYYFGARSSGNE